MPKPDAGTFRYNFHERSKIKTIEGLSAIKFAPCEDSLHCFQGQASSSSQLREQNNAQI